MNKFINMLSIQNSEFWNCLLRDKNWLIDWQLLDWFPSNMFTSNQNGNSQKWTQNKNLTSKYKSKQYIENWLKSKLTIIRLTITIGHSFHPNAKHCSDKLCPLKLWHFRWTSLSNVGKLESRVTVLAFVCSCRLKLQ